MKKALIVLALITIYLMFTNKTEDYVIVPKESIRFRIIPNSNTPQDIFMKEKVKEEISSVINNIENKINTLFAKENYNKSFNINYGMNYFPEKIYKGVKYEEGYYESMVIEIGESEGDNYWCVLFPPLCLIEAEESDDVEYSFFINEIIKKFFK